MSNLLRETAAGPSVGASAGPRGAGGESGAGSVRHFPGVFDSFGPDPIAAAAGFDLEEFFDPEEFDDAGGRGLGLLAEPALGDRRAEERRAGTLAELVSLAAAADRHLATATAVRAEAVEQVRAWCLETEIAAERDTARAVAAARAAWNGLTHDPDPAHPATAHGDADAAAYAREARLSAALPGSRWTAIETASRTAIAELACALRLSTPSASNLMDLSEQLATRYTATLRSLEAGRISYTHARILIDTARSVPEAARPTLEALLLPPAEAGTPGQFARQARRLRETRHPESLLVRRADKEAERRVYVEADADGMGWLHAYLQMPVAQAIQHRVSTQAATLQAPDEPRTLDQLRADVLAAVLIDGETPAGIGHGIRATVHLTIPVLTLLRRLTGCTTGTGTGTNTGTGCPTGSGLDAEHAILEGYGPIDAETAAVLAAGAPSFTRLLTHPETGVLLSVGREQYAVPADLKRLLRLRDGTCRFPGCIRPATDCELDHTLEWQHDGQTCYDNLANLCAPHHRLKTQTTWDLTQHPGGTLTWTAPSGLRYQVHPENPYTPPPPDTPPPF